MRPTRLHGRMGCLGAPVQVAHAATPFPREGDRCGPRRRRPAEHARTDHGENAAMPKYCAISDLSVIRAQPLLNFVRIVRLVAACAWQLWRRFFFLIQFERKVADPRRNRLCTAVGREFLYQFDMRRHGLRREAPLCQQ